MAYIEVPHLTADTQPYRTFTLPNDSSARTLQDLKFPESGGGFGFLSGNEISSSVRNRFIYWRYCNGSLEIMEDSLDTTLRSGWLKFIFSNTCVLHAEAFEHGSYVQMLVCTAGSAVRLLFRHPKTSIKSDSVGALRTTPSIFHDMDTPQQNVVPVRALQQPGQLRCATARLRRSDGSALFAFCLTTGSVMLVEMPPPNAVPDAQDELEGAKVVELRQSSMMTKLWNGIVPSFASRGDAISHETATDGVFLDEGRPTLLLTVCRDHKLRMWNVETRDLAVVTNLLDRLQDKVDVKSLQIKSQGHSLRRSQRGGGKECTSIGVHLNFVSRSYILIFVVNEAADDVHSCLVLDRRFVCDPHQDIVDWAVVPSAQMAWVLLQSEDGYALSSHDLREPGGAHGAVTPALLLADVLWGEDGEEEAEAGLSLLSPHQDPQEACLDAVFTPGRFSAVALGRAIAALRQSCDASPGGRAGAGPGSQAPGSVDALKEEIIALVESKIADAMAELSAAHEISMEGEDVSESEVLQIRLMQWSEFYASVVDYQRTCVSRPVGLVVDHSTGLVGVIRKAGLSLFRHADPVEICSFLPLPLLNKHAMSTVGKQPNSAAFTSPSILLLLRHCRYLQHCIGAQALNQLYAQLELANEEPSMLASALLSECLRQDHELEIVQRLSTADNLVEAFLHLVEIAEDLHDAEEVSDTSEAEDRIVGTFSHPERFLFASPLAVDSIARSVDCILTARLRLAVALLLVQQLLTNPSSCASVGDWLTSEMTGRLQGPIRIRVVNLIRNLVLMRWLATVRLSVPPQQTLDRVASQLLLLGCSAADSRIGIATAAVDYRRTLLEVFYESSAGEHVRRRLRETGLLDASPTEPAQQLWEDIFPVAAAFLQASVCPSSAGLVLALCQFLLVRGQIQILLKLTRLLDGWWQLDPVLVHFVRGVSLLNAGQPRKGLFNIVEALKGLSSVWDTPNSSCLPAAVLGRVAARRPLHLLQVNIALKVMRSLEIAEEPLLVVELAHRALRWLEEAGPSSRTSGHSEDDKDEDEEEEERLQRRLALRRHREEAKAKDMEDGMELEDDEPEEEEPVVEEETQLRGVLWTSIFKHELAVGRSDKAFTALLSNPDESSRRDCLRQLIVTLCDRRQLETLIDFKYGDMEEEFVTILQSRARAVDLQVYNYYDLLYSFHVRKGNYRGAAAVMYEQANRIAAEVRSLSGLQKQARAYLAALTAFRLVDVEHQWLAPFLGDAEEEDEEDAGRDVEVDAVELGDVEREYALVKARLRLAEVDIDHSMLPAGPLSVSDTCRGLLKLGLYNVALHLCRLFAQPLDPVFEALAARCVSLPLASVAAAGPQQHRELQIEKAVLVECLEEASAGPGYEGLAAAQLAWRLLQAYLEAHPSGDYWRCAVAKLLAGRHFPPAWLLAEGKRRNPSALLRLFILHDEVEAAVSLAVECIDGAMSRGGGPSVATTELRLIPHMWMQQLLAGLEILAPGNSQCALMRDTLKSKLNSYMELLGHACRDKAMLRLSRGAKMHLTEDLVL